jgi:hypothetical protein
VAAKAPAFAVGLMPVAPNGSSHGDDDEKAALLRDRFARRLERL